MAERAILARECQSGRFQTSESRWGGTDSALAAVFAGTDPVDVSGVAWETREEHVSFQTVVEGLDYLMTTALYRAGAAETSVFIPLWFGLPIADVMAAPTAGALVGVTSLRDVRTVRSGFRTLKGTLTDGVRDGTIPATAAPLVLREAIASLEDRECYLTFPFRASL